MGDEEPKMYMNPPTGSVDTIDNWYPYTEKDGLIEVYFDDDYGWTEVD